MLDALGLAWADLYEDDGRGATGNSQRRIVATYPYEDEAARLLYEVCRYEPKDFRPRRPDGNGGWISNLNGTRRVLYRLPELLAAGANGQRVYIVEGEKDVQTLVDAEHVATCNPGGAGKGKWRPEYNEFLRGADVAIIADADEPGRRHAREVAAALEGIAARVKLAEPAEGCKDITEHWRAGKRLRDLRPLASPPTEAPPVEREGRSSAAVVTSKPWPVPPATAAFHGLAGEIVKAVEPHSEADPAVLLVGTLVAFGSAVGRGPGWHVGGTFHATNCFALVIGRTAGGRKGTAWDAIRPVFERADAEWARERVQSGLSSGEGLVHAVRDPHVKQIPVRVKGRHTGEYEEVVDDHGVEDKRLLAREPEFAQVLRVMRREGNTLSAIVRQLWDGGNVRTITKGSPERATGAHVSIIGDITAEELRRELDDTSGANGFANRFLFVCAQRSKELPFGGRVDDATLDQLGREVGLALRFAKAQEEIGFDEHARELWAREYGRLSEGRAGMFGAVTARAEAQVRRLATLYALMDLQPQTRLADLEAALALWRYCEASARYVFGDKLGAPLADQLLNAIRDAGADGLSRSHIRNLVGKHVVAERIDTALELLASAGLVEVRHEPTKGRPIERWFAVEITEKREEWAPEPELSSVSSLSSAANNRGSEDTSSRRPDNSSPEQQIDTLLARHHGGLLSRENCALQCLPLLERLPEPQQAAAETKITAALDGAKR